MTKFISKWVESNLGKAANINHKKPSPFEDLRPYVATADVQEFSIIPSQIISYRNRPSRADLAVKEYDILQAKMKDTNKAVFIDVEKSKWIFSTGFACFSPLLFGNDPLYFFHYFQSAEFLHKRDILTVGTTQQAVSDNDLSRIKLTYPVDLSIQRKISTILSIANKAIEKTDALIKKYKQIKTGLMQDLFTRGVTPDGKLRPPREQAPELYKKTEIGWIPKEWLLKRTGDVCQSIVPGRDKPVLDGGKIPWITIPDITDFFIQRSKKNLSLSKESLNKVKGKIIPKNSVIMSCVGDFGIAAITQNKLVINQQLHAFIVGQEVLPEWLVYNLRKQKELMEKIATQTTIKYLNKEACESIPMLLPPQNEQKKLVKILRAVDSRIDIENQALEKLVKQKQGLMQDLLTGKVTVNVESKEIADV